MMALRWLATAALWPLAAAGPEKLKLYVYAEGNLRNTSFLPVLMNWTTQAKACGYDGMFYADSDFQTLHLGPPAGDSGCEWCGLGSAGGFLQSAKTWQQHAAALDFDLNPLVFPFGPSDPILLQPEPTEGNGSSIHNLVEPVSFRDTQFKVGADSELALLDSMGGALQNADFAPPASGNQFAHWAMDRPGNRTFADRQIKRGGGGASLRIGPGAGDGMAMQPLNVPPFRLAKISFWAKTENFSAVQYNVELRTTVVPNCSSSAIPGYNASHEDELTAALLAQGDASAAHQRCGSQLWMSMGQRLSWWPLALNATQDWSYFEFTAPTWSSQVGVLLRTATRETTGISHIYITRSRTMSQRDRPDRSQVGVFLGIEDRGVPQVGNIWFDDVSVEEMALLNVVRREGAPLSMRRKTAEGEGGSESLVPTIHSD